MRKTSYDVRRIYDRTPSHRGLVSRLLVWVCVGVGLGGYGAAVTQAVVTNLNTCAVAGDDVTITYQSGDLYPYNPKLYWETSPDGVTWGGRSSWGPASSYNINTVKTLVAPNVHWRFGWGTWEPWNAPYQGWMAQGVGGATVSTASCAVCEDGQEEILETCDTFGGTVWTRKRVCVNGEWQEQQRIGNNNGCFDCADSMLGQTFVVEVCATDMKTWRVRMLCDLGNVWVREVNTNACPEDLAGLAPSTGAGSGVLTYAGDGLVIYDENGEGMRKWLALGEWAGVTSIYDADADYSANPFPLGDGVESGVTSGPAVQDTTGGSLVEVGNLSDIAKAVAAGVVASGGVSATLPDLDITDWTSGNGLGQGGGVNPVENPTAPNSLLGLQGAAPSLGNMPAAPSIGSASSYGLGTVSAGGSSYTLTLNPSGTFGGATVSGIRAVLLAVLMIAGWWAACSIIRGGVS